jgi:glycine cleavage system H protein
MESIKYSRSHEWVKIEDDTASIGISEHAQKALGDIVFIELPKVGSKVLQLERFGIVESTKAASELFAPLSGEVIEINTELLNNPQWINEDPLNKAWMIKIKIKNIQETTSLMDEVAYKNYIAKESH